MKLYLSSYKFGNDPQKLAGLVSGSRKGLLISNALDYTTDLERKKASISSDLNQLSNLGIPAEELDLRNYFGNTIALEKKLTGAGMVWVMGGNAFVLRRAMRQSGMDQIIHEVIRRNDFVYAGYSAGACVTAPTLRGIDLVDDPHTAPVGYEKEIIWEGLSLVSFCIAPHYQSDHPESALINRTVAYFEQKKIPYRALRDGEVIIVAG